ncbi:MAG: hypothetical protein JSR98_11025 [Proteobacteria bacterium]|nr:hypothetical protein [Pseudomonadota bacterium]
MEESSKEKSKRPDAKILQKEARDLSDLALRTLKGIMEGDGQATAKLAAAREVLDRAYGKPKPAAKPKVKASNKGDGGLTVIVKRFSDITPEEEAAADATERGEL